MSEMWLWPVPNAKVINSPYGYRIHPVYKTRKFHTGIDIPAPAGETVVAVMSGKVTKARDSGGGFGNEVQIDHGNGLLSQYAHNSKLLVSEGQQVRAGDKIAEIGTTGTSTGNHLHFGVKLNGSWVDPEKFVSTSGPTAVNTDSILLTEEERGEVVRDGYTVDAAGITTGQRVSGVTPQPVHAYFSIYVKVGEEFRLLATTPPKPNVYQSFEYTRLEGSAESASFVLFDDDWEEIEKTLAINFNDIYIEYGYYGTGVKSNLVRHQVQNYDIEFRSNGSILTVSSVTQGAYNNLKPKTIPLRTYNPTEAVKEICRTLGYIVLDENFDESQDISADNPFNMIEEHPITYIQSVIIPQASQEGDELFSFDVDSNNVAYFKKISYSNSRKTDKHRTYIYQKGYDNPIISLEFQMKGIFSGAGALSLTSEYRSVGIDNETKEQQSNIANKASVVTEASGDTSHMSTDQSSILVDSAGYTSSQMKSKLYYDMKVMNNDGYACRMTIVGDPTIQLNEYIRLINITDKGTLHHTSGVYRVHDITDSISGGAMTTTLTLSRSLIHNIEGVEIINPKILIK